MKCEIILDTLNEKLSHLLNSIESFHWWFVGRRLLLQRLIHAHKLPKNAKILDIGCGTGGNYEFLSKFGKVSGVDNLKSAIYSCRRKGIKNVHMADAASLPFKNEVFEVVTALDVLEHIKDDQMALKEAKRVLKKNGVLIVTAPSLPSIWSQHDEMQGHFRRYTEEELLRKTRSVGLKKIETGHFNVFLALPIIIIRKLSKTNRLNRLSDYDSRINFDIAKIKLLNNLLIKFVTFEVELGKFIKYPKGITVFGVFKK